jgi:hypothetical protein
LTADTVGVLINPATGGSSDGGGSNDGDATGGGGEIHTGTVRWKGGIPAEEGLRFVDSVRHSLHVPLSRNIAFAEISIDGKGKQLVIAVSGSASPLGTVASPTSRLFQTRTTRGAIPTQWDSEVKILEDIARGLPRDARGTINLFTERPPCPSCRGVIDQFREMFPHITVNVTHGGR